MWSTGRLGWIEGSTKGWRVDGCTWEGIYGFVESFPGAELSRVPNRAELLCQEFPIGMQQIPVGKEVWG